MILACIYISWHLHVYSAEANNWSASLFHASKAVFPKWCGKAHRCVLSQTHRDFVSKTLCYACTTSHIEKALTGRDENDICEVVKLITVLGKKYIYVRVVKTGDLCSENWSSHGAEQGKDTVDKQTCLLRETLHGIINIAPFMFISSGHAQKHLHLTMHHSTSFEFKVPLRKHPGAFCCS